MDNGRAGAIRLGGPDLRSVAVAKEALYPEGIEFDSKNQRFLLGSVREGTIYEVSDDGTYKPFITDDRLISTIGIRVDKARNRLLVANSDYGVSIHTDPATQRKLAALAIYDLSSGDNIAYVDLGGLRPDDEHFANDIAVDDTGNAYITDSLSPIIYKVDPQGNPTVFVHDERFVGEGFNLNGIVYHPDGYLIVAKKSEGALFVVPLDNPGQFRQIATERAFVGTDGLLLAGHNDLMVITNLASGMVSNRIFALHSDDGWTSAAVMDDYPTGDVYPSTGTVKGDQIYVIYGRLNTLSDPENMTFLQQFQIQQVGFIHSVE